MQKFNKEFFTNREVLFIGYSSSDSKNLAFSKQVYHAFSSNGIKVIPLNNKKDVSYDVKVYHNLSDLPKVPECAYLLLNSSSSEKLIDKLADSGVKKILFQNHKNVSKATLEYCSTQGIETAVACPMMVFGSGIHRLHGFFAGVKR